MMTHETHTHTHTKSKKREKKRERFNNNREQRTQRTEKRKKILLPKYVHTFRSFPKKVEIYFDERHQILSFEGEEEIAEIRG